VQELKVYAVKARISFKELFGKIICAEPKGV